MEVQDMNLKQKLGEELYNQVMEKLDENEKLILNDGSYLPREEYNKLKQEKEQLQEQVNQYDEQLKELKKQAGDNEELKNKIKEYEDTNKELKTQYEEKIKQMSFEHSLDKAISQAQPRDAKAERAVKALIDRDKLNHDPESGEITGLKEQLDNIKEEASYLFEQDSLKGAKPKTDGQSPSSKYEKNPFSSEHWNLTEQGKILREDPEMAEKLKAQAK